MRPTPLAAPVSERTPPPPLRSLDDGEWPLAEDALLSLPPEHRASPPASPEPSPPKPFAPRWRA